MDDLRYFLTLHHAPKLGARKAVAYLRHYGSARAVCEAPTPELAGSGMHRETLAFLREPRDDLIQKDLAWQRLPQRHLLSYDDAAYPERLREIRDAPLLLFCVGNVSLLKDPQIAVIGSRRPTSGGLTNARQLAAGLARAGLLVTSGLAYGIDTAAHEAALDAAMPTVAVVGTGADVVYPAKNKKLAARIVQNGVIVSEFSCGTPPHAANFPRRNRLMSGLALGVLVVEASERSGSLITAASATEQNREVFAVPGSIRNPLVRGCHRLIQSGGKLVQTAEDVLAELAPIITLPSSATVRQHGTASDSNGKIPSDAMSPSEKQVLALMEYDEPVSIDVLVERSHLAASKVSSILLTLELNGFISSENNVYVRSETP